MTVVIIVVASAMLITSHGVGGLIHECYPCKSPIYCRHVKLRLYGSVMIYSGDARFESILWTTESIAFKT